MRLRVLMGAALTSALACLIWPTIKAHAQPQCNTRDSILRQLSEKYDETPVASGITHNGGLMEVFATKDGGTWSIVITSPGGWSCLLAAGEGWRQRPAPVAGSET